MADMTGRDFRNRNRNAQCSYYYQELSALSRFSHVARRCNAEQSRVVHAHVQATATASARARDAGDVAVGGPFVLSDEQKIYRSINNL